TVMPSKASNTYPALHVHNALPAPLCELLGQAVQAEAAVLLLNVLLGHTGRQEITRKTNKGRTRTGKSTRRELANWTGSAHASRALIPCYTGAERCTSAFDAGT